MTIAARVLADSVSPTGVRLTTLEVTFPRIILAEINTHRMFSRNSASSRAIPVERRLAMVRDNPFVPRTFGANKRGMQAGADLDGRDQEKARAAWLAGLEGACAAVERMLDQGVHKQWANRLLEPFAWHTAIISATEWANFFALRCHPDAQPEMQDTANTMLAAIRASQPSKVKPGGWHLPLVGPEDDDLSLPTRVMCSVARCAAVSYDRHVARDVEREAARYQHLRNSGHLSPFEHAAVWPTIPQQQTMFHGNFFGWRQQRKDIPYEDDFTLAVPR